MRSSFLLTLLFVGLLLSRADIAAQAVGDCDEPASFEVQGTEVVMTGTIVTSTEQSLFALLDRYPGVRTLVLSCVSGSDDDEANLDLGRRVSRSGLTTLVPDYAADASGQPIRGFIASGGVDLFLAGRTRALGQNACVGIHSWSDSDGTEASQLDDDHPDHEPYFEYYEDIGFTNGDDFYFATLDAAPADGMHFMTAGELVDWGIAPGIRGSCPLPDEGR